MLKYLEFSNYRSYEKTQGLICAPITLIYGQNNTGKTSILNILKLLKQSLPSDQDLVSSGEEIDLGTFKNILPDGEFSLKKPNEIKEHFMDFDKVKEMSKTFSMGIISGREFELEKNWLDGDDKKNHYFMPRLNYQQHKDSNNPLLVHTGLWEVELDSKKNENNINKQLVMDFGVDKINKERLKSLFLNQTKWLRPKESKDDNDLLNKIINFESNRYVPTICGRLTDRPEKFDAILNCILSIVRIKKDLVKLLKFLDKDRKIKQKKLSIKEMNHEEKMYMEDDEHLDKINLKIRNEFNSSFHYPKKSIKDHGLYNNIKNCKQPNFLEYAKIIESTDTSGKDVVKSSNEAREKLAKYISTDYRSNWDSFLYINKEKFITSTRTVEERSLIFSEYRYRVNHEIDPLRILQRQTTFIQVLKSIFSRSGDCLKPETMKALDKECGENKSYDFLAPEDLLEDHLIFSDFLKKNLKNLDILEVPKGQRVFHKKQSGIKSKNLENEISQFNKKGLSLISNWLKMFNLNYDLKLVKVSVEHNVYELRLKNNDTGHLISIHDMGRGLRSILSLLIKLLNTRPTIWIAEEIEQNLHPKAQAKIADFLVKATIDLEGLVGEKKIANHAKKMLNQFIIETHSEYLILRLLKLVKQKKINPNFISINYVEMKNGRSKIYHLPIDNEGKFKMKWPDGFLPEADDEDM